MTVTAYLIGDTDEGRTKPQAVGVYTLYYFVQKATQKPIKGGGLQVFDAQITSTSRLPDNAIIEIESKWYQVASPTKGMLGMFLHSLTETLRPENL